MENSSHSREGGLSPKPIHRLPGRNKSRGKKNPLKKPIRSNPSKISKRSKWEEGLQVIDELLVVDSDTHKAMTEAQRKALANVKSLLLGKQKGSSSTLGHVPRELLIEQRKEQKRQQRKIFPRNQPRVKRPSLADFKRGSTYFILQEYAGVKSTDPLLNTAMERSNSSHSVQSAPAKTRNIPPPTRLSTENPSTPADLYTPQEFKELPKDAQQRLTDLLSWESISTWGFDIFELHELTHGQPLLFLGWAVLGSPHAQSAMRQHSWKVLGKDEQEKKGYHFVDDPQLKIPPHKLCNYLRVVEHEYHSDNPYHNDIHAADTLQALHSLIQMALTPSADGNPAPLAGTSNVNLFAILLSAVVHDVDHPGKNNAFQTKTRSQLAVVYNDLSVLENWHVAKAFSLMLDINLSLLKDDQDNIWTEANQNKDSECNLLCNAGAEFDTIRNLMIEAVLHTDMTKHFAMVDSAKGMIMQLQQTAKDDTTATATANTTTTTTPPLGWNALLYMLHMSDISNQAKPGDLARIWTDRCMTEFFRQGDQEQTLGLPISANCDKNTVGIPESQVGFIKFVVQPAYTVLGELIPVAKAKVLPMVQANLEHWQIQLANEEGTNGGSDDCCSDDDVMSVDG